MSAVEVCEQHPMWCTRQHRVGANPNRLTHENVLELTTDKKYPKRVTSYVHRHDGHVALYVRGIRWFDDTVILDLKEPALRVLGERLIEMADAALSEQAIWNATRGEVSE